MEVKHLKKHSSKVEGVIDLPYSKSVLNRYLILARLADFPVELEKEYLADDTVLLAALLANPQRDHFHCANAGTVIRFLTAYLATREGEQVIDGSPRMRQRPIGPLVDALRHMGADISYLGEAGFPPLRIGSPDPSQSGKVIKMNGSVSSQFYTALLLVAAKWPGGVTLELPKEMVSKSYLEMTLRVLESIGVRYEMAGNRIQVPQQSIQMNALPMERDWSSAAFFFVIAALAKEANLFFPGLVREGTQGDEVICDLVSHWGVYYEEKKDGMRIFKTETTLPNTMAIDLKGTPDLMPALAVLSACSGVSMRFSGVEHLRYKESDRIEAMSVELAKGGVRMQAEKDSLLIESSFAGEGAVIFDTWGDHRVAMSLSLISMLEEVGIRHPEVVSKSFPDYWDQLEGV